VCVCVCVCVCVRIRERVVYACISRLSLSLFLPCFSRWTIVFRLSILCHSSYPLSRFPRFCVLLFLCHQSHSFPSCGLVFSATPPSWHICRGAHDHSFNCSVVCAHRCRTLMGYGAQIQRKAQRHANRCNTKVFTPHFRQQRHTHLDLNQFFSPNLALSSATPLATEARREDMRTSSSGSSIPLLLPLPPFSFRSTDDHHHLVPVEVRCPPNQPTYEGSVGATTKAPCPAITLPSSFLHPPFTLPKIGAITLPSPSLHPSFTLPSAKRAAVVTVTWPYLQ